MVRILNETQGSGHMQPRSKAQQAAKKAPAMTLFGIKLEQTPTVTRNPKKQWDNKEP